MATKREAMAVSLAPAAATRLSNVHATYLIIFMQSAQENEGFIYCTPARC